MSLHVVIQDKPLHVTEILDHAIEQAAPDCGALTHFVGIARGTGQTGEDIQSITLEHYENMSKKQLSAIASDAQKKWKLKAVHIHHRIGTIKVGEVIVVVITLSAHRAESFASAQAIMDWLKKNAPFWKYEQGSKKGQWVTAQEQKSST